MRVVFTISSGAIAIGVIVACVRAAELIGANRYLDARMYRLATLTLRDEFNTAVFVLLVAALISVAMLLVQFGLRMALLGSWRGRIIQVVREIVIGAVVFAAAGFFVNRFLLGDRFAMSSLFADAGMLTVIILGGATLLWPRASSRMRERLEKWWLVRALGAAMLIVIATANVAVQIHAPKTMSASPNIVFILVDTLRRDHLGVYGYGQDTSPNIDALAKSSTVFSQGVAQAPSTKPSVASMFTSRYPSEHGAIDNFAQLPLKEFTMAELLRDAGYATAAFVENPVIRTSFQYEQGFAHWHENLARVYTGGDAMMDFDERIVRWVKRQRTNPFFLYVHYLDPHSPYDAPAPYFEDRYVDGEVFGPVETSELTPQFYANHPEKLAAAIARYDEEIRFVDDRIGWLLDTFRDLALFDDLVVVFVSDHGEGFMEHGRLQHSYGVYAELLNVPFLIKNGSAGAMERDDTIAQHIDLLPTIAELAGIDVSFLEPRGRSLMSTEPPEIVVSEYLRVSLGIPARALFDAPWKLIHNLVDDSFELYNVVDDPSELRDRSQAEPETMKRLSEALAGWVAKHGASNPRIEIAPDDETTELLEALGYL